MLIGIIGGGISGLSLALQLNHYGFAVEIFESAKELSPLGLGLNLQPKAVKILANCNLFDELITNGVAISSVEFQCKDGLSIFSQKRGIADGYDFPQIAIHRAKLQQMLLKQFTLQPKNKIYLGQQLINFQEYHSNVVCTLVDRTTNNVLDKTVDILIGADGIHSTIRAKIHNDKANYQFAGIMMWRGISKIKPFQQHSSVVVRGNRNVQLITYPISPLDKNGECYINWVVEIFDEETNTLDDNCWNKQGHVAEFIHYFNDWQNKFLDIEPLFDKAINIFKFPMVDRNPLNYWNTNRVTLIGDAAHPMYPRGANGASQGIIDAEYLATVIHSASNISDALQQYQANRLPITSKIVLDNRNANQLEILSLVAARCQKTCQNIHTCIDSEYIRQILTDYKINTNLN